MRLPAFSEATFGEDHVREKARPAQRILEHEGEVLQIVKKFCAENPRCYRSSAEGYDSDYTGLYLLVDPKGGIRPGDLGRI